MIAVISTVGDVGESVESKTSIASVLVDEEKDGDTDTDDIAESVEEEEVEEDTSDPTTVLSEGG
jgi:hypothetical protein